MRNIFAAAFIAILTFPVQAQTLPEPGEWLEIPDTSIGPHLPTVAELGTEWCDEIFACGSRNGHVGAWTSGAWVQSERKFYFIRPCGHTDCGPADSYTLDMNVPDWSRSEPVQHLTGQLDNNGRCPWPAHGGPSQHTYDGVVHLGGTRFLHLGSPGACSWGVMTPAQTAFEVDRSTTPWRWTEQPQLLPFIGINATAIRDGVVYLISSQGDWAKIDATTLQIIDSGVIQGVMIDGATMPYSHAMGGYMGAGEIIGNLFCVANKSFMQCSAINGTVSPDGQTDNRFGRFHRRSLPETLAWGGYGMAPAPDGERLVIWRGRQQVHTFRPDQTLTATPQDEWQFFDPASGPTSGTGNIYGKLWYDASIDSFVGFNSRTTGVWLYRLPDAGDPPAEDPPVEDPPAEPSEDITCGPVDVEQTDSTNFLLHVPCQINAATEPEPPVEDPPAEDPPPAAGELAIGPLWAGPVQTADFADRCATPGVFFCQDFNDQLPQGQREDEGLAISQRALDGRALRPTVQNGYLRFYVPSETGADLGWYFIDFAERGLESIGPGESVFVQWQQYMPRSFVETGFQAYNSNTLTRPKQIILSATGDSSCTANHVVVTGMIFSEDRTRRMPRMYRECGFYRQVQLQGTDIDGVLHDDEQPITNAEGQWIGRSCWNGNIDACVEYTSDRWVTYQIGLTMGTESYMSGRYLVWPVRYQLWVTVDGEATELVIDSTQAHRYADLEWGSLRLIPYMTNKDWEQVHEPTFTDYDELILSTQRVPDPQ